jgi:hypothetical protein
MNSSAELNATYYGFIGSTLDALILFEACISGQIKHVSRRPHDREREHVIQSGRVFIYEENTSGIKRWTDGISWSPSRILGNFLIYRQLVKAFGPGEKKKAIKKSKVGPTGVTKHSPKSSTRPKDVFQNIGSHLASGNSYGQAGNISAETERALIGSLTDSYDFLNEGLVKKTISVTCDGVTHHLVSYYTIADAVSGKLSKPSKDPRFSHIHPRGSLVSQQSFRAPLQEPDPTDEAFYPHNRYEMPNQTYGVNHVPMESNPTYAANNTNMYNSGYTMPLTSTPYENNTPAYAAPVGFTNQYVPSPGGYPAQQRSDQYDPDYRQRIVVAGSAGSDGSRAPMPTATHVQRESSHFNRRDSDDSGVSMSMDKVMNDPNYNQGQNSYYGYSRDAPLAQASLATQKVLPSLVQDYSRPFSYDRAHLNGPSYNVPLPMSQKESWQMGNASIGHGHYLHV